MGLYMGQMADIYGALIYSLHDRITMDWLTGGRVARTAASATLLFGRGDHLLHFGIISKRFPMRFRFQRIGPDYGGILSRDENRPNPDIKLKKEKFNLDL